MPDWLFEREAGLFDGRLVAGVDEVGRGPLAGPVYAAAATGDPTRIEEAFSDLLDDSKKLTARKRALVANTAGDVAEVAIAEASVEEIDEINILRAAMLAMSRAVISLGEKTGTPVAWALIDGNRLPDLPCPGQTIVKGDSQSCLIALASIVAKDARDAEMSRLAEVYPGYGWERNAGYGTTEHLKALRDLGVTPHHRRSFSPVRQVLESQ